MRCGPDLSWADMIGSRLTRHPMVSQRLEGRHSGMLSRTTFFKNRVSRQTGSLRTLVLEGGAFRVGLDDDEHVQIRVGSGLATSLGTQETQFQQVGAKDLASICGESIQRALSDRGADHGCSITSRFPFQSDRLGRDLACHGCGR